MLEQLDPDERAALDAALEMLGREPLAIDTVAARLHAAGLLDFSEVDDAEDAVDVTLELLASTDDVWVSSDETLVVRLADRLDAAVFTHRLTDDEISRGVVALVPDLVALDRSPGAGDDGAMRLAGGGEARVVFDDADLDDTGLVVGPPGWLAAFAAGDVVAFVRRGSTLEVARVDVKPGAGGREGAILRDCYDVAAGGDAVGVDVIEVVFDALTVNSHAFRAPVRPIVELLADVGLTVDGDHVGPIGTDFVARARDERLALYVMAEFGLDECCAEAFALARLAFGTFDDPGLRSRVEPKALADALVHGDVARALVAFATLLDDDALVRLATFAQPFAEMEGRERAGGAYLMALVVEQIGQVEPATALVEKAVLADPSFFAAVEHFARHLALRGELDDAIRVRRMLEVDDDPELEFLMGLRPVRRAAAGRNDPCPCGSGRKYKVCCLNKPVALTADAHAMWLHHKLLEYAFAPMRRARMEDLVDEATQWQRDPRRRETVARELFESGLAAFWVLFEDGLAANFQSAYQALLPDIEHAMLDDWLGRPLALYEVVGTVPGESLTLRDTRTGDEVRVHDRTSSRAHGSGELLLAHVGTVDGRLQYVGFPLAVDLRHRATTLELIDADPTAADVAAWYAAVSAPPRLANREGHRMVLCEIDATTAHSPDELAERFDALFGDPDDADAASWTDTFTNATGETIVRSFLRLDDHGVLHIETNSAERADELLARLAAGLDEFTVVRDERRSPEEVMGRDADAGDLGATGAIAEPPAALQAALHDYVRAQERAWCDESIPALGGLTPRQAADDPTRREDLIALLRSFDAMPAMPGGGVGFDAGRLRALLGL